MHNLAAECMPGKQQFGGAVLAVSFGRATAASETAETRTYKHLKGETEIPVQPQRVVSLFHLGELMAVGVRPVGATPHILANPLIGDTSDITNIGNPPDLEKILLLEPDLIVTTEPFAEVVEGGYEALSQIAPTIVVEQYNDPIKDVEMFGDIHGMRRLRRKSCNTKKRSARLLGRMKRSRY
jgi:iron complex transport system substrate-binding protein